MILALLLSLTVNAQGGRANWNDIIKNRAHHNDTDIIRQPTAEDVTHSLDRTRKTVTTTTTTPSASAPANPNETPQQAMARYNSMKADGKGTTAREGDRLSAHCIPNLLKRKIQGFKCTKINPASGIAAAGIVEGDIILKVDGQKIASPESATALLGKVEHRNYSEIVIVREGRESILAAPIR